MIDIELYIKNVLEKLEEKFQKRLLFLGLQGSYNRGEATDTSDIDLVVILDKLNFKDIKTYRTIIESLPYKDKACGFISGKAELQNWTKADMFQFFYDTKPLYGKLEDITEPPTKEDVKQAVKTGAENLYHAAVHSFIHSNDFKKDLKNLYKAAFFILQAKYFVEFGTYIKTKKELAEHLNGADREILNICINKDKISNTPAPELESLYRKIILWSKETNL